VANSIRNSNNIKELGTVALINPPKLNSPKTLELEKIIFTKIFCRDKTTEAPKTNMNPIHQSLRRLTGLAMGGSDSKELLGSAGSPV
jgi:hypothetical protein